MDTITSYIKPELLVLVPALYFIGTMLKSAQDVKDKYIPLILGACGIVLATAYVMASALPQAAASVIKALFTGITQGILCAGCSVYVNQLFKQHKKDE
mgnify:FL=1|jgi:hypothetical protein